MVVAALTALLAVTLAPAPQSAPQAPPPPAATAEAVDLGEVQVTGRPLEALIRDFVAEVGEPNPGRGLARWDVPICVGVANLRAEAAQYLADRISTVAQDIGIPTGAPGCSPNLLVIASSDGNALSQLLVDAAPRSFRMGGAGMDRGGGAFHEFQTSDRPVRWWQLSMPVDSQTGARVTRLPGECEDVGCTPPTLNVAAASRLKTQVVNTLFRSIVIVDVDKVTQLSILQLADYIAMVSLAQIDPDADTRAYASILNVIDDPAASESLTEWDTAYLAGLYAAERNDVGRRANRSEISRSIHQAHRDARAEGDEAD